MQGQKNFEKQVTSDILALGISASAHPFLSNWTTRFVKRTDLRLGIKYHLA